MFHDFSTAYDSNNDRFANASPTRKSNTDSRLGPTPSNNTNTQKSSYNIPEFSQAIHNFVIDSDSSDSNGGVSPASQKAMGNSVNSRPNTNESGKAAGAYTAGNNNTAFPTSYDQKENTNNTKFGYSSNAETIRNGINLGYKVPDFMKPLNTQTDSYKKFTEKVPPKESSYSNNYSNGFSQQRQQQQSSQQFKQPELPQKTNISRTSYPAGLSELPVASAFSSNDEDFLMPTRGAMDYLPLKANIFMDKINQTSIDQSTLQTVLKGMYEEKTKAESETRGLKDQLASVEQSLARALAERDELAAMYSTLEKQHEDYSQSVNNLTTGDKKTLSGLRNRNANLEAELENKTRKYESAKVKNRSLAGMHDDLEKQAQNKDKEIGILRSKISSLQADNDYLKLELNNARMGIAPQSPPPAPEPETELSRLQKMLDELKSKQQEQQRPLSQPQAQAQPETLQTQPKPSQHQYPTAPLQYTLPVQPARVPTAVPVTEVPLNPSSLRGGIDVLERELARMKVAILGTSESQAGATASSGPSAPSPIPAAASIQYAPQPSVVAPAPASVPESPAPPAEVAPSVSLDKSIYELAIKFAEIISLQQHISNGGSGQKEATGETVSNPIAQAPIAEQQTPDTTLTESEPIKLDNGRSVEDILERLVSVLERRSDANSTENKANNSRPGTNASRVTINATAPVKVPSGEEYEDVNASDVGEFADDTEEFITIPLSVYKERERLLKQASAGRQRQPSQQQHQPLFQRPPVSQTQPQEVYATQPSFQQPIPQNEAASVQNNVLPWSEVGKGPHVRSCSCNVCNAKRHAGHTRPSSSPPETHHAQGIPSRNLHSEDYNWEDEASNRPSTSAEEALKLILGKLKEEYGQLNTRLKDLTMSFGEGDPAVKKRQRDLIADRIRYLTKEIQSKADQIYALHDINIATNLNVDISGKPVGQSSEPGLQYMGTSVSPRRSATGILPTLEKSSSQSAATQSRYPSATLPKTAAPQPSTSTPASNRTQNIYHPFIPSPHEVYDDDDDVLESDLHTTEITGKYTWKA